MTSRRHLVLGLACALLAPSAAQASTFAFLPSALVASLNLGGTAFCQNAPATPAFQSKADALLGGAPSAMSLILREQQEAMQPAPQPAVAMPCPTPQNLALAVVAPAPAPSFAALPAVRGADGSEFLGSRRVAISRTMFDDRWERVSHAAMSSRALNRLGVNSAGEDFTSRLAAINAWANTHIRYEEDQAAYGQADYWASSKETLRRRAGDCEDIAILKYQMLAAAGVPRASMYLTIARDLARRADHALLIVRDGARYWMLDNATNALVDAGTAEDYRPIFSFSEERKWIHGYTAQPASAQPALTQPALAQPLLGSLPSPALNAR